MSKYDLHISAVLLRIMSLTLRCVLEEPFSPLPLTTHPVVQTVCDLKGLWEVKPRPCI